MVVGPNGNTLIPPKNKSTGLQRSNSLFVNKSKAPPIRTKVRSNSYSSFKTGDSKDSKGSRGSFNPRKIPWEWKVRNKNFFPSEAETEHDNDSGMDSEISDEHHEAIESLPDHGHDEDHNLRMEGIFHDSMISEVHDASGEASRLLSSRDDLLFSPLKIYGTDAIDPIYFTGQPNHRGTILGKSRKRSVRRKIFLIMTDPSSSYLSLSFFYILSLMILSSNIVMIMETMRNFQYIPNDCEFCHDQIHNAVNDSDDQLSRMLYRHACICPPKAYDWISSLQDRIINFFTVELILRIICFDPGQETSTINPSGKKNFWNFLTEMQTIIDALATFPYYLEKLDGLRAFFPVRMLRLFRVFQFIRLGQYDSTFCALVNVFTSSVKHLSILCMALVFSGGFFGYLIYWFEKGEWEHTDLLDPPDYAFVRIGIDGVTKEISPFKSIPDSFWWFIVTATTVGYGDVCPTSFGGKIIASAAMIFGVFVVAFPVSIFAELWRNQLKALNVIHSDGGSQGTFEELTVMDEIYPNEISAKIETSSNDHKLEDDDACSNHDDPIEDIYRYMSIIDDAQQKIRMTLKNIESSRRKVN